VEIVVDSRRGRRLNRRKGQLARLGKIRAELDSLRCVQSCLTELRSRTSLSRREEREFEGEEKS
jgi:hypothetical protein